MYKPGVIGHNFVVFEWKEKKDKKTWLVMYGTNRPFYIGIRAAFAEEIPKIVKVLTTYNFFKKIHLLSTIIINLIEKDKTVSGNTIILTDSDEITNFIISEKMQVIKSWIKISTRRRKGKS